MGFSAEIEFEQEAERKIGWLLKLIFAGTATAVAYQFFPYMGTCSLSCGTDVFG